MAVPDMVTRLSAALVATAGGYLRNPVRQELVTCAVCATPAAGFRLCYQCQRRRGRTGLADATGFLSYAAAGRQSGYVMQGYKARPPVREHREIVTLLVLLGLARHAGCAGRPSGPVTHWATVPSLPAQPGEHPLHAIVSRLAPGREAVLAAAEDVDYARDLDPGHFRSAAPLPTGAHVLLVDDTWARGGHAQSAVLALRAAGAARVSVLVAARWVNEEFGTQRGLPPQPRRPRLRPGDLSLDRVRLPAGRRINHWRGAGVAALAGHMNVERFDAGRDTASVRACHEIYLSGQPADDPLGPPMPRTAFAGWLALGWTEDPVETWLARDESGEPYGWYQLGLPQRENRHRASLELAVHAARRRGGRGTALLRHAAGRAHGAGRTVLDLEAREGSPGAAFAGSLETRPSIAAIRRVLDLDQPARGAPGPAAGGG